MPSKYDHSSSLYWVRDDQLRPSRQPNSRLLFQKHNPSETYSFSVGTSGASSVQSTNAYLYHREGLLSEAVLEPKAVEFAVEVTLTGVSTNAGLVQIWAANPEIRTTHPNNRRWLQWSVTPDIAVGTILRGTIMAPVGTARTVEWQGYSPAGWTSTWLLRPIGAVQ
jgi:hypothetical protein